MPIFLMILLSVLPQLLGWLLSLIHRRQQLPPRVAERLAKEVLPQLRQIREACGQLGVVEESAP